MHYNTKIKNVLMFFILVLLKVSQKSKNKKPNVLLIKPYL